MQKEKIELYCKINNIEIINTYIDEGFSAKSSDRPSYNEMMNFISNKDNKIDGIIVYKADRIHRSLKHLMIMIDYLKEIDVNFISITEQFDSSTAQGLLFLQMIGSFSEFERKLIVERTHSGRVSKGFNFSRQRVHYIISNPIYIGKYIYDGKVEKNKINLEVPSIISRYLWN